MIKLEHVHIEEVRGIRKLDIDFGKENFSISGPNGSGKSGVIDAIEFGLTGQIGRLTGRGTKGLSVAEHGPHVDKTKFPDAAFVRLRVFLPALCKSATITRKVSSPKKPKIEPSDEDVIATLAEIADHPEVTLSRREILRFILVEPTKRSEEIQTILKLEEIGQTRAALNTAQNRLQTAERTGAVQVHSAREVLQRHLQIATLRAEDLLESVNSRRKTYYRETHSRYAARPWSRGRHVEIAGIQQAISVARPAGADGGGPAFPGTSEDRSGRAEQGPRAARSRSRSPHRPGPLGLPRAGPRPGRRPGMPAMRP
jgi:AAA domain